MKKKEIATVLSQRKLAEGVYDMWLDSSLAAYAHPGQFVAVYTRDAAALLPRPISICEVNDERTAFRLVYRVAGRGTAEFSGYRAGDRAAVLGILGNGFPLEAAEGKRAILCGGGIGVPPILQLAKEVQGEKTVVLGYRDSAMFLKEDFEKYATVLAASEDGSSGTKGNVLDVIREQRLQADVIMACGPMPMLRAVKRYAEENGIQAYISLEERMACGVGACLGCVAKTKYKDSHSNVNNARICTDGPVFDAQEVEL